MLDELVGRLTLDLEQALRERLVAVYLTGSAVAGDFDAGVSDIDIVAVVSIAVDALPIARLDAVHARFFERNSGWLNRLEIVYVNAATLRHPSRGGDRVAVISPGDPFHITGPASDWLVNWHQLRTSGKAVVGPPPKDLVAPVRRMDFIAAVRSYLDYLAGQPLKSHHPGGLAYAVLSVCRAINTIETGEQLSKVKAAKWLKQRSPELASLIDASIATRASGGVLAFDEAIRTSAIRFVRESAAAFGSRAQQERDAGADQTVGAERDR